MLHRRSALKRPRVGLAYAAYVPDLVHRHRDLVDYVELPFERLRHDIEAAAVIGSVPTVLHCASLSVAGVIPASVDLLTEVRHWAQRMETPWVGEHLAFISAEGGEGERVEVGYTVAPPLNSRSLDRVANACSRYQAALGMDIILENPPQYFAAPGSTMTQIEFISALCEQSDIRLLFDVSHFLITARNCGMDPLHTLRSIPLHKVQEVHLSGVRYEMNTHWDDHGVTAPKEAFVLLRALLEYARPQAITLEYNWSANFPEALVLADLKRVHRTLVQTGHA